MSGLRVIVSLCKSGSTALIHSLAHAEGVTCYFQTVKSGQRLRGAPDYGIYRQAHSPVALSKETIGPNTLEDCTLEVFPDDAAIRATRPVFLLRDPVDTWAAWSRAGWGTFERFTIACRHLLDLYDRARALRAGAVMRYEAFGQDPEAAFRQLCGLLGIDYTPAMIDWRMRFPEESPVIWREDVQRDIDNGLSDSARAARGFRYRKVDHVVPARERAEIGHLFRERYAILAQDAVKSGPSIP